MNVSAVCASSMPWLAQSPAAPEHGIRHVNVPAVRAVIHALAGAEPCSKPNNSEPFSRTDSVESVGFEASFPGASFMPWLAQMPGATATTMSSSLCYCIEGLQDWRLPLSGASHAVTGAEPRSDPYDSELLAPAIACTLPGLECTSVMGIPGMPAKRTLLG